MASSVWVDLFGPVTYDGSTIVFPGNVQGERFLGADGTAAAPTFSFYGTGDSDNGMYLSAADTLGWSTGGTLRASLSSASFLSTVPMVLPAGGGSGTYQPSGVITVDTTQAATTAVTTEETLWTYSLPANTLNANGKGLQITAWGSCAANNNNKTWKLYFGSDVISTMGPSAQNNKTIRTIGIVIRTGASASIALGQWDTDGSGSNFARTTPTGDTTGAITIKITGQNGTANAGDLVFLGALIEVLS